MKNAILVSASLLVLASGSVNVARAADLAPAPDTSEWRFSLAPYVWGVGLSGDVGLFGLEPVEVDIPFSDIIENLDFAAMGVAEAHNGTWGVLVDINYTHLSASNSKTRVLETPNTDLKIIGELSAEADITEFIGTVMGQWRAVDSDQMTLDVMAGARYWNIDNEISVKGRVESGEVLVVKQLSGSDGASWVDPMVGVKSRIDMNSPFYLTGWGMIGGFGVGSDFSWDVMGGVGYQWTDHFATVLGYRALGVDYEDDGFVYDIIQQGAALGAVVNF